MRDAHDDGQPVLRGLFHEFPADARSWSVKDQCLLGPDLLVAPVLDAGARARTVVLPAGADWTDLWSGTVHPGGGEVEVDAPLERIPLFVRDGAMPEVVAAVRAALGLPAAALPA
ncbi:TIM-barrel domain-containing protein [Microbacterium testaceum]|uniref:TIM-barrel domain-containing protein n=1 Tax=Microbacterium testaceum TaxID=2033 RepID=UPI00124917D4